MGGKPRRIHPHGELEATLPGLWQVTGRLDNPPILRNMAVWKAPDGGLLLHSVVALDEARMAALEALGKPSWMVIPHAHHQMDAAFYLARYPGIGTCCPAESKAAVEARSGPVHGTPAEVLAPLGIASGIVPGLRHEEPWLLLPLEGGGTALVACDSIGNGNQHPGFLGRLMAALTGTPGGRFGVSKFVRFFMLKDREALRAWLREMAAREGLRAILFAHGRPVVSDARAELERAAAEL